MKTEHRIGLKDKIKSGLFFECYRILKEVNPIYFLMENVASMKNNDRDYISSLLGINPIRINSEIVSAALRDRYYWTNIPNVTQPKRVQIKFQDVLTEGYTNREKAHCLVVTESRPLSTPVKMFHRYYAKGFWNLIFKNKKHFLECCEYYNTHYKGMKAKDIPINETEIFNGVRYPNQTELERCQTVPERYTKCLTRNEAADVLGDGWTIDVIAHIFSFLL
jgi:DNA (cytosine-5)-methyltransferase 3A